MPFTSGELLRSFFFIMGNPSNDASVSTILMSKKFFPDSHGYYFLTQLKCNGPSQAVLSGFFYKRFLIKSYIELLAPDIIDCLPRILDPYIIPTDKPYYYTKFMLHKILFPSISYTDKRIDFDISCVIAYSERNLSFNIVNYEPQNLYREIKYGLIIKKINPRQKVTYGRLSDDDQIVPLSIYYQNIATSLGLYIHEDAKVSNLNNNITFRVKFHVNYSYLYQDKYLLHNHNNRIYFIGKIIDDQIYDLTDKDINMLKS